MGQINVSPFGRTLCRDFRYCDVCQLGRIVEYVLYLMAKLVWHRSVGYGVQLFCHA
jgi:hypothetical protein